MTANALLLSKNQVECLKKESDRLLKEEYSLPDGGGPTWHPSNFAANCLPVHLVLLPEIKKMGIGAAPGLVIGELIGLNHTLSDQSIDDLKNKSIFDDSIRSGYHAWISLDINDPHSEIIDLTGPAWDSNSDVVHYYNRENATKCKRQHFAVLTKQEDVYDFISRFVYNHFRSKGTSEQVERNVDSMLRLISELHDVPHDTVIGHWGRSIRDKREEKEKNKEPSFFKKIIPWSKSGDSS